VALLHGLFGQAGNFGAVQKRLAGRFRVIALDLRNHGASPHAEGMAYADMAADVLETLGGMGVLPAALVGHSMGGKVAMAVALAAPEAVERLVVADIAPVAYPPHLRGYVAAMAGLAPGLSRGEADAALADAVPEAAVRGFLLQNRRFGPGDGWKIGLGEIGRGMPQIEAWEAAGRYDGKVLFIAGGRSDYIRPEHRPVIRALFPAARFVTLKQAGHWLHAEDPEGFLDVLEGFLG
jgi:esterase